MLSSFRVPSLVVPFFTSITRFLMDPSSVYAEELVIAKSVRLDQSPIVIRIILVFFSFMVERLVPVYSTEVSVSITHLAYRGVADLIYACSIKIFTVFRVGELIFYEDLIKNIISSHIVEPQDAYAEHGKERDQQY